ncbi:MAG: RIP metalloprotease RseP [Gammaproteobacteria bacterium]|jgi:regulator of sigma E protease|nr:RIP metalloprotease RseP [Gammaproteobacteria bacterium]NBR17770.1 RIP metalloprotease RseP [Gammaproteobacteria bacterium]NCW57318.1 RIP metalloprotease RseP [Gammaproteobacteria bacterium]NDA43010.1 RIP metalloprotease RseP [Gammaproteobacteria bacterium]NDB24302.1 RIP metalloprotease RseP [Gammaproteobacteria bacterium]
MDFLWTIAGFVVAVSLLVTVHEYGHFWVARKLGFKVLRFSVGFGPALWRRVGRRDGTEYVFAALPLGGYVKLLDEREGPVAPEDLASSFTRKAPWQRILVLLAGPAFNIIFAILVLWAILWSSGEPQVRPVVGKVVPDSIAARADLRTNDQFLRIENRDVATHSDVVLGLVEAISDDGQIEIDVQRPGSGVRTLALRIDDPEVRRALTEPSALLRGLGMRFWTPPVPAEFGKVDAGGPAALAGLQPGDRVTAIDGEPVADFPALVELISARPNRDVVVSYLRNGQAAEVTLRSTADLIEGKEIGRIRVATPPPPPWPAELVEQRDYGPLESLTVATQRAWDMTVLQAKMFARMLFGQVSLKNLSGPLSIAEFAGESAQSGLAEFLGFLIVISLSLGFLNLLPIPILDGGQIVYQLIEWFRGSPIPERVQALGQQVGIALLLMLMGIALFNDFTRQLG